MPWEVSAIKMLWKQSHYLTYQQVHSWCHDDVSSVNQTWQETPEVIMIKRHFQKWRISFFLKIGIFVKRVHPPFTFSEALHVLEFQSPWKMFWVPGCGMAVLLDSASLNNSMSTFGKSWFVLKTKPWEFNLILEVQVIRRCLCVRESVNLQCRALFWSWSIRDVKMHS